MVPARDVDLCGDGRSDAQVVLPRVRLLVIGERAAATAFVDDYNADGGAGRMRLAGSLSTHDIGRLDAAVRESRPDRVVLLESDCGHKRLEQIVGYCVRHGLTLELPEMRTGDTPKAERHVVSAVHPRAVHPTAYRVKRLADVSASAMLLAFLSPFLAAIAVMTKASSAGPVLYVSWRMGLGEEVFPCYKFRTMHVGADVQQEELESRNEADGCLFKIRDDPRVTRVGRFLRRTSLDELPQLINVLRGEMSLVGPRPLPLRDVARMDPEFHSRHAVLPGLTGLWQVSARGSLTARRMMELDLEYIRTWSLGLDLRILLQTLGVVLGRKGAF